MKSESEVISSKIEETMRRLEQTVDAACEKWGRLQEINQEMLAALKAAARYLNYLKPSLPGAEGVQARETREQVEAAIQKAGGAK